MAYKILLFGDLPIPDFIRQGDSQNMGTGRALTAFRQLPGGGWYDNYRGRRSPQGIRPITKSGVFVGTEQELDDELMAWRALLGERRKLTVRMSSGRLMWQWAILQDVDAQRPSDAVVGWNPVAFTWISVAQNWRGVVYGEEDWTWGDGSWLFGDGTAELGVGAQEFTLSGASDQVLVTHGGSIDASNVLLRFTMTGTWQDITIVNHTTGQHIVLDRDASSTSPTVEIDAGARSIYVLAASTPGSGSRNMNTVTVVTDDAHNLVTGDTVRIANSTQYNGDYYPITVVNSTTFTFTISHRNDGYGTAGVDVYRMVDLYSDTAFSDLERWLVLVPGTNVINIAFSPTPTTAALTAEFVDHYA